jgi:hypothetical protein
MAEDVFTATGERVLSWQVSSLSRQVQSLSEQLRRLSKG